MELTARNTDLQTLANLLRTQEGAKADAAIHATKLRATDYGWITISDTEPLKVADEVIDDNGVTPARHLNMNGTYELSDIALGHFADRLGIDRRYLRKLAEKRPDILAANINGWLHGFQPDGSSEHLHAPDARTFTARTFQTPDGSLFRGLLSDRYGIVDNLDVLNSVLLGVQQAGADVEIVGCDLSENRMRVRVAVPAAQIAAPILFAGYRNPFSQHGAEVRVGQGGGWDIDSARSAAQHEGMGYEPGSEPIVFAGFEFGNGELGDGATYVVPRAVARICANGLVLPLDAARKTHVGERLEEGVIDWSSQTRRKALELITSKTADAVTRFASVEFWAEKVAEIEAKAGKAVTDPDKTIKAVSKTLRFTDAESDLILRHFIKGGQMTAAGVMNAVTSAAQTVADPDAAADMERAAVKVLDFV